MTFLDRFWSAHRIDAAALYSDPAQRSPRWLPSMGLGATGRVAFRRLTWNPQ
jgi:hypothetical protein